MSDEAKTETVNATGMIDAHLRRLARRAERGHGWAQRHAHAWVGQSGAGGPIVLMIQAWASYADQHSRAFDSPIGADYVLGVAWVQMANAIIDLLNGDCGELDCGTVDRLVRDIASSQDADLDADE